MVQLEDQLGPATSSSGPGNSKGKQRHAAVGQPRQVLKPGWVSRKPAATSLDNNNAQPSVSPESRSKLLLAARGPVPEDTNRATIASAAFEHNPRTSTIRFVARDGIEQYCSVGELIHQIGTQQIWQALDAISVRKASQASVVTTSSQKTPRSFPPVSSSDSALLELQRGVKEKRDRHLAEGSVQPEPTAQQKRTLKRKQRHEESSEASGPTVAADVSFGSSDDGSTPGEAPMTFRSVRIGDEKAVQHYFNDACEAMQQLATKWILKQWIKAVEPNKQSTFPYSENSKRSVKQKGSDGAPVDNAKPRFRPSWWPPEEQMRHKEPDHLKKNERMLLFWSLVNACDTEKAIQNLDDDEDHENPWTELLEASTKDRKNLRTPKEKAHWDVEENRKKWQRRNQILNGVYELLRKLENFKAGECDATTMIACFEPLNKSSRSKKSADSGRSAREDSVASDATVAEDHEQLAPRYSTRFSQQLDADRGRPGPGMRSVRNSFDSSRDTSPDESNTVAIRATVGSARGIVSASQSFNSHYEPAMLDRSALHRQSIVSEHGPVGSQMLVNKSVPSDDPFQLSDLRDPLTMVHTRPHATMMEWSQSERPHFGGPPSAMIQGQRVGIGQTVPCHYDTVPHPAFHQESPIGAAYPGSEVWQQTLMPQTSFTSSFDGIPAARAPDDVDAHDPHDGYYFGPPPISTPHAMGLSHPAETPDRRADGIFYAEQWVPQPPTMDSAPPTHPHVRMRR